MQALPHALADALSKNVVTGVKGVRVREIKQRNSTAWLVEGTRNGKKFALKPDAVITAIPSGATAELFKSLDGSLSESLNAIYYPPVVEVFLGFKAVDIRRALDGFGFLVPANEHRKILGTIWSSSLFPGRAPKGCVALTTFVGGSRQPELTKESDDRIVKMVAEELDSIMGVSGRPVYRRIARWDRAIPQYNLGHFAIVRKMEEFETQHLGLFISGNFRGGISVGDCVINSEKTALRVQEFLKVQRTSEGN